MSLVFYETMWAVSGVGLSTVMTIICVITDGSARATMACYCLSIASFFLLCDIDGKEGGCGFCWLILAGLCFGLLALSLCPCVGCVGLIGHDTHILWLLTSALGLQDLSPHSSPSSSSICFHVFLNRGRVIVEEDFVWEKEREKRKE